jgi:hypothetical protein
VVDGSDSCHCLTAEVALGHVGLVLGHEVSRLVRNNADWHRLIAICAVSARYLVANQDFAPRCGAGRPAAGGDRQGAGRARYRSQQRRKSDQGELTYEDALKSIGDAAFHYDYCHHSAMNKAFVADSPTG